MLEERDIYCYLIIQTYKFANCYLSIHLNAESSLSFQKFSRCDKSGKYFFDWVLIMLYNHKRI